MIGLSQRDGPPLVPNRTHALLEKILERLDHLEARVEGIAQIVDQGPPAIAAVTDTLDEAARHLAAHGPPVDERVRSALHVVDTLTQADTAASLGRIVDRLTALEPMIEGLTQLPNLVAGATDVIDELARGAAAAGVDVDARLASLRGLLVELTAPPVLDGVRALLPILPQLAPLAHHAQAMPGMVAMAVDVFDDWVRHQTICGLDPEQMLQNMLTIGSRLTSLLDSAEFNTLMSSGVLSPQAVQVVGRAARALSTPAADGPPPKAIGPLGLLRALRDPDLQRSLHFGLRVARGFGRQLDDRGAPALLNAPGDRTP